MDPDSDVYAHTVPGRPQAEWEPLADHLNAVAELAATYGRWFDAEAWGRLAGAWHDLGKLQPAFQHYLRGGAVKGPPHAWAGAVFALTQDGKLGFPLASVIAAHHGQLANVYPDAANGSPPGGTLSEMIAARQRDLAALTPFLPAPLRVPNLPGHVDIKSPIDIELFTRFLFSVLIDADRTATATFYARHTPALTSADLAADNIATLATRLDAAIDAMPPKGSAAVVELRRRVLDACRAAADRPRGRFSLTVPTGGGKTLSAMSFALNHARTNGMRRVIVVIPYTSIIEQSARVYANVLDAPGRLNVLEHHSNIDEQTRSENESRGENLRRLASENWDAPVVVTTTVQFFESLLAAHGSRCRKVHNIAGSVILLDEVQTLPPQFLETIVDVLARLTDGYACSVVLSTATPPALKQRPGSTQSGLSDVHEIMPDPSTLAAAARRVTVEWRVDRPTTFAALADELIAHRQVLAIVHRRADAARLAGLIGDDALHLSASMCPAHRVAVLADVRRRLDAKAPCRLVSTQLIEAGVDVDFPVVYRALAGLDSIAQSAGRCDREGKITAATGAPGGRLVVFLAETDPPPGVPRKAFDSMRVLTGLRAVDVFEPNDSLAFFQELYAKIGPDERRVQPLRRAFAFSAVAAAFRLIDNDTHAVVVPYINADLKIDGPARLAAFRRCPNRGTARALQPLIVQVRQYQLAALRQAGVTMPLDEDDFDRFDILCEGRERSYHRVLGLSVAPDTPAAEDLVA